MDVHSQWLLTALQDLPTLPGLLPPLRRETWDAQTLSRVAKCVQIHSGKDAMLGGWRGMETAYKLQAIAAMHLEYHSHIWWDGYQLFYSTFPLMRFSSFYEQGLQSFKTIWCLWADCLPCQLMSGSTWAKEMLFDFVATSARKHLKHMPFRELAMTVWSLGTVLIANDPFVTFGEFSDAVPIEPVGCLAISCWFRFYVSLIIGSCHTSLDLKN